jgi:hypothetical protein
LRSVTAISISFPEDHGSGIADAANDVTIGAPV